MKKVVLLLLLIVFCSQLTAQNQNSALGINLGSPVAWQDDWQYVNIAHHSIGWFPLSADLTWDTWFSADELQNNSYPQPGTNAVLCPIWDSPRPINQDFVLTWDGVAQVELVNHWSSPQLISSSEGRAEIRMDDDSFLFIKFSNTDANDPLKNVRLVKKEHENLNQIFTPEFLDLLAPFRVYRFMDFMQTNGSVVVNTEDYSSDNNLFKSQVPLADITALVNEQNADPWICIPLTASDSFVYDIINRVCDNLHPNKTLYLELSNEVWNGIFESHAQAGDSARALGLTFSENNWEAAPVYYGYRSAQIHDIADSIIKAKNSDIILKRVIAWQSGSTYFIENFIMPWYSNTAQSPDSPVTFAIAPYFGYELGSPENVDEVLSWSAEKLIEQTMEGKYLGDVGTIENAISALAAYEPLKEKYNIESLIAYEAGQHIVGHSGAENNDALTSLFIEANRNDKMYEAYMQYLAAWKEAGGKLCAMFSSHGTYSKWGSWGLKEKISQSTESSPKYRACLDFIDANPVVWSEGEFEWQDVSVEESKQAAIKITPNPAQDFLYLQVPANSTLAVYNLLGEQLITRENEVNTEIELDISELDAGTYILQYISNNYRKSIPFIKI